MNVDALDGGQLYQVTMEYEGGALLEDGNVPDTPWWVQTRPDASGMRRSGTLTAHPHVPGGGGSGLAWQVREIARHVEGELGCRVAATAVQRMQNTAEGWLWVPVHVDMSAEARAAHRGLDR